MYFSSVDQSEEPRHRNSFCDFGQVEFEENVLLAFARHLLTDVIMVREEGKDISIGGRTMSRSRGSIKKRLDRLEHRQRELEFKKLAMELKDCQELTETQWNALSPRLSRLFDGERLAEVSLEAILDKLPEVLRLAIVKIIIQIAEQNSKDLSECHLPDDENESVTDFSI
jgi:hypothetical protein